MSTQDYNSDEEIKIPPKGKYVTRAGVVYDYY